MIEFIGEKRDIEVQDARSYTATIGTWNLSSELDSGVRDQLKQAGYTLTSQRRAVLEALDKSEGHPSAEEVYLLVKNRNPRVALGTVYQALSVLEKVGIVESKYWAGSPVRYDLNLDPHLDIRCVQCGRVDEVPGVSTSGLEAGIKSHTPYLVKRTAVLIEGLCPKCQRAESR